jgi:hypothetical protein
MAGRLVVTTLNNDTGVLATQNGMTGIPKAWLRYNGATQTIIGSYNISSVTYNSTGNYTANFTTAMPNANYAALAGSSFFSVPEGRNGAILSQTTSAVQIAAGFSTWTYTNSDYVAVAVFSS